MILYRSIGPKDFSSIFELAKKAQLLNLPLKEDQLLAKLLLSEQSFGGLNEYRFKAEFVFAAEELSSKKLLGSSQIIAKHGTPTEPHVSFLVQEKVHRSHTMNIEKRHYSLKLYFDTDGPSELGGLYLDPEWRQNSQKMGLILSLVRFLYVKAFAQKFMPELLVELMGSLRPDGSSALWDELGFRFTGLTYAEADRLSFANKDFIPSLFPTDPIYTCFLSEEAQATIGAVGAQTKPVQRMLERQAFKMSTAIDPFDGGPHYVARVQDIPLIRQTQNIRPENVVFDKDFDALEANWMQNSAAQNFNESKVSCLLAWWSQGQFFTLHIKKFQYQAALQNLVLPQMYAEVLAQYGFKQALGRSWVMIS